jgi:hypothetical protein
MSKTRQAETTKGISIRLTLTHPTQHPFWGKYHILFNDSILLHFSVDAGYQSGRCVPLEDIRAHKDRSYWSKFVEGLCVEKLATGLFRELKKAARKVVAYCVPKDIG